MRNVNHKDFKDDRNLFVCGELEPVEGWRMSSNQLFYAIMLTFDTFH